jgi:hypothetical protein
MPDALHGDLARLPLPALLTADPGRVVGLVGGLGSGLTRLGLVLLADPARRGMVAAVDVRGWLCPAAAWEVGIPEDRLVVIRCADRSLWPKVTAALLDGITAVYAEVPVGVPDAILRRLGALARARAAALLLRPVRGSLPAGLAHLSLAAGSVHWEGADAGHGRLTRRRLTLHASGRGALGIDRTFEVDDDGTDSVRVVSGLGAAPAGRAAG